MDIRRVKRSSLAKDGKDRWIQIGGRARTPMLGESGVQGSRHLGDCKENVGNTPSYNES